MIGVRGVEFIGFIFGWGIEVVMVVMIGLVSSVVMYCVGVGEFIWWLISGEFVFGIDCISFGFIRLGVVVDVGSSRVVGGGGCIVMVVVLFGMGGW